MSNACAIETDSTVIVVDPLQLRRASVHSFLSIWGRVNDLSISAFAPDEEPAEPLQTRDVLMAVLSIGGLRLSDPEPQRWLDAWRDRTGNAPLVIVTDCEDADQVLSALRASARGFVPTNTEAEAALRAFSFILTGGTYYPPTALLHAARERSGTLVGGTISHASHDADCGSSLTHRQSEVLALIREGKSNKMIGRQLSMCESTVKVHVRQIMRKLGASNRTQAALSSTVVTNAPLLCLDGATGRDPEHRVD
ncbi:MAG: response regulator transcription factor [Blastochloris sp.]|nr:response regulator transcription factor [Blastochloris sp.]